MQLWTCFQCGAQFAESREPPAACQICADERQFVTWSGQRWLAREEFAEHHRLAWRHDLGISGIGIEPSFAIGQRAVSYTHLRAHETRHDLVCRLLLEKK